VALITPSFLYEKKVRERRSLEGPSLAGAERHPLQRSSGCPSLPQVARKGTPSLRPRAPAASGAATSDEGRHPAAARRPSGERPPPASRLRLSRPRFDLSDALWQDRPEMEGTCIRGVPKQEPEPRPAMTENGGRGAAALAARHPVDSRPLVAAKEV